MSQFPQQGMMMPGQQYGMQPQQQQGFPMQGQQGMVPQGQGFGGYNNGGYNNGGYQNRGGYQQIDWSQVPAAYAQDAFPWENTCSFTGQVFPNKWMPAGFVWKPGQGNQQGQLQVNVKVRKSWGNTMDKVRIMYVRLVIYGDIGLQIANTLQTGAIIRFSGEFKPSISRQQGRVRQYIQFILGRGPNNSVPFEIKGIMPCQLEGAELMREQNQAAPQMAVGGMQGGYPQQGGYPMQQPGYPQQQQMPIQQQGFPQQQQQPGGFPVQQMAPQGFPQQQRMPQQGGFPVQQQQHQAPQGAPAGVAGMGNVPQGSPLPNAGGVPQAAPAAGQFPAVNQPNAGPMAPGVVPGGQAGGMGFPANAAPGNFPVQQQPGMMPQQQPVGGQFAPPVQQAPQQPGMQPQGTFPTQGQFQGAMAGQGLREEDIPF